MAPQMMKAAICKEPGKPLVVEEIPVPEPTGRFILVKVKAASLCHSDLGIIDGTFGSLMMPLVVGHEAISIVEKLGPDAGGYGINVGDTVGASLWHDSCLNCVDCKTAGAEFCKKMQIKGMTSPGCFSEYTLVDPVATVVVRKAEDKSDAPISDLSPLFCAGITVWDAIERAKVRPGDSVAILGVGGLGQMAARYATELGAKVFVLDVRDEQLNAAKSDGIADETINIKMLSPQELEDKVMELNGGVLLDTAIVTTGVVPAYLSAMGIVRVAGHIIAVGLPHESIPLNSNVIAQRCFSITGAKVPGKKGIQRCIDYSMKKNIRPKINDRKFVLEDINEMIALMKAGEVDKGRMLVEFF
ncbi:hypothetical protein jhhlp_004785 [Lomentospora prolificans]|uniref:Enoyl reductase (ER) domain-containing protein n=1 Tax=Lomentospora prolificans TaxID=41688 RepID=A0A2N3N8N9_9PEZI|nr:hypothetical protein jhhlp_004785 [Lomentospora prolificans]